MAAIALLANVRHQNLAGVETLISAMRCWEVGMSSVWDAVYNPEPSELETKVTSYEARIALLEAENQRLRESAPDLERTKIAMAMYRGHAVLSWDEAWAGTLLQEQEE